MVRQPEPPFSIRKTIIYDKIDIAKAVNAQVIGLEDAPKGYSEFDSGVAKKFVIDPPWDDSFNYLTCLHKFLGDFNNPRTYGNFDMDTGSVGELSQPGGSLYNIEHSNGGLITFPGGVPIKNGESEIVGAIGVSGSVVEDDHAVAKAGAAAY